MPRHPLILDGFRLRAFGAPSRQVPTRHRRRSSVVLARSIQFSKNPTAPPTCPEDSRQGNLTILLTNDLAVNPFCRHVRTESTAGRTGRAWSRLSGTRGTQPNKRLTTKKFAPELGANHPATWPGPARFIHYTERRTGCQPDASCVHRGQPMTLHDSRRRVDVTDLPRCGVGGRR